VRRILSRWARIVSRSIDRDVRVWDAVSGLQLPDKLFSIPDDTPQHTLDVLHDRWLVDLSTNRTIAKLPIMVELWCSTAYEGTLAMGTIADQIIIMKFPPAVSTTPETRPIRSNGHGIVWHNEYHVDRMHYIDTSFQG